MTNDNYNKYTGNYHLNLRITGIGSSKYWEKIEVHRAEKIKGINEKFCEVNTQLDPDFINLFGTDKPSSDTYLLHFAPGWNTNPHKIPVMLIHGAGLDASSFTNIYNLGYKGLQQRLVERGHRVFSLTFPHSHGNNFLQAEIIADAIDKITKLCNCSHIDLIAHSKGGIAVRIYLSGLAYTPYRGDVRRFIMLGVPNMGTDYAFRNPSISYLIFMTGGNGVIAWDKIFYLGNSIDITPRSIYKEGCFPGQSQILYPWDDVYPLDTTQQDWWTTYYGGSGFISHSRGIKTAIKDGGFLIDKLEKKGIAPEIEIAVLAGNNNFIGIIPVQTTIPSDGIVFVDSALNTEGMTKNGAKLINKTILPLNHIELLYNKNAAMWVHKQLTS
ncbi:hypothetical protein [Thermosyntropha sp.]|uniref:esterase/lipase family protein n=1 Tax=Thermosyntropha sp. TaxID=2740820 RepID=UPI0025FEE628|nr:hypothetical protein [Thermosyntropha sp.]MBO8157997.1 acetyltransferase [Thermosyntropha sp.]